MEDYKNKYEKLLLKYEEIKKHNQDMNRKLSNVDTNNKPIHKHLLGLEPGKIYLIITDGRRIVGKLVFENTSFICYTKREGTPYYANKTNIKLIKELSPVEQKTYLSSNFQKVMEEEESESVD